MRSTGPPRVQIPAAVIAKEGENPSRRKGKGFPAMVVSRELAGPKAGLTGTCRKGKGLIFPCHGGRCGNAAGIS